MLATDSVWLVIESQRLQHGRGEDWGKGWLGYLMKRQNCVVKTL